MSRPRTLASAFVVTAFACSLSPAAFINPDFSAGTITNATNGGVWPSDSGEGWNRVNQTFVSISDGMGIRSVASSFNTFIGMAQYVNNGKAITGTQTFKLDYSVAGTAQAGQTYTIRYDLVGTDTSASSGGATKITIDGTLAPGPGVLQSGVMTGLTVGSSGSFSDSVNFGSGYTYLGIRIQAAAVGGSSNANTIRWNNVQIVPEPMGAGLLGLVALSLGRRARR